jgi:hypothetical protein
MEEFPVEKAIEGGWSGPDAVQRAWFAAALHHAVPVQTGPPALPPLPGCDVLIEVHSNQDWQFVLHGADGQTIRIPSGSSA